MPWQIGARAGLGHGDGGHKGAVADAGQPALLLRLGSVMHDVRRDDRVVQRDAEAVDALGADLLHQDQFVAIVAARAAIFLGHRQAEQAGARRLEPHFAVDDAVLPPARRVGGCGVLVEEAADGILEDDEVFLGQDVRPRYVQNGHQAVLASAAGVAARKASMRSQASRSSAMASSMSRRLASSATTRSLNLARALAFCFTPPSPLS